MRFSPRNSGQSNLKPTHKFTQCELAIGIYFFSPPDFCILWNQHISNVSLLCGTCSKIKATKWTINSYIGNYYWKVKTGEKCSGGIGKITTKSQPKNETKEWIERKQCQKDEFFRNMTKGQKKMKNDFVICLDLCKHFERRKKKLNGKVAMECNDLALANKIEWINGLGVESHVLCSK